LLGVTSTINEHTILFMIDSGATNNFISKEYCDYLGLSANVSTNCQNVLLADGTVLKVIGSVRTIVDFG
jgi:predicted aspartyl protease